MNKKQPKKVLIIGHTNIMGGVETFIRNTTLYSDPGKVKFYFLIHGYKKCLFQDEINQFYGENHFFFFPKIKKHPIKTIIQLLKFYKEHQDFDYVHVETGAASEVVYCYPYCKRWSIKVIIHSHNGGNLKSFISHQFFVPLINRVADKKLACSRIAAEYMFGKQRAREADVIPVGIDLEKFKYDKSKGEQFRKQYQIPGNSFVIGVVGRFTRQKNQEFAIDIFENLCKKNVHSMLILKGQGELEDELVQKIKNVHLESKIIVINRIDHMEELYSALDVFLMPSLFEGLPQVSVEAQANGLPCVFSDTISVEADLTGNNQRISLECPPDIWADCILDYSGKAIDREYGFYLVKEKGYDIRDTVKKLEEVYGIE